MFLYFIESYAPLRTFFIIWLIKGALLDPQRPGLLTCMSHLGFDLDLSLSSLSLFLSGAFPGIHLGASSVQWLGTGVEGSRWRCLLGGVGSGLWEGLRGLMMSFLNVTLTK